MPEAPNDILLNSALVEQVSAYGLPIGPERDTAIERSKSKLLDVLRLGQIAVEPLAIDRPLDLDNLLANQLAAVDMAHRARRDHDRDAAHSAGQVINTANEQLLSVLPGLAGTKPSTKCPDEK